MIPTAASMAEQKLSDDIADVTRELTNSDLTRVSIKEDFFVKVFLPMFSGDPRVEGKVTPEMWFNLAHGPFNEVNVVGANGEVLFAVPPYYSQKAILPLDGTGKAANLPSITDMVKTANNHAFRAPGLGDAYMAQEIERRSFMFNPNADLTEEELRWQAIFQRYGIAPATTDKTLTTAPHADIARDSTEFDPL